VCRPALGAIQPPIQWVLGATYPVVKKPVSEAGHSPPSSVEVKNVYSHFFTSLYIIMAWCLIKHRNKFTFTLHHFYWPFQIQVFFFRTSVTYALPSKWDTTFHTHTKLERLLFSIHSPSASWMHMMIRHKCNFWHEQLSVKITSNSSFGSLHIYVQKL
jgi:hypothetical protein